MRAVPRNNISTWMHDVHSPSAQKALLASVRRGGSLEGHRIPIRDISPPTTREVATRSGSAVSSSARPVGVPLAVFAASFRRRLFDRGTRSQPFGAPSRSAAASVSDGEEGWIVEAHNGEDTGASSVDARAPKRRGGKKPAHPADRGGPGVSRPHHWPRVFAMAGIAVTLIAVLGIALLFGKGIAVRLEGNKSGFVAAVADVIPKKFLADDPVMRALLGYGEPRTYLVLFQNNATLRPTGGFIGAVGTLLADRGDVTLTAVEDAFDLDGRLLDRVIPPQPLQEAATAWSLHDANWFFETPKSLQKAAWFFERSGGTAPDGVIAVTSDFFARLLSLTGPVTLSGGDEPYTDANAVTRLHQQADVGYGRSLEPPRKAEMGLAPAIMDGFRGQERDRLETVLLEALAQREMMVWSADGSVQRWLEDRGWAGVARVPSGDVAAVVHTNVDGFRTDAVMEETVEHRADIADDGRVTDTLTIIRRHKGGSTGVAWWDAPHKDYLRVYAPLGSRLLSAEGFSINVVEPPIAYAEYGFAQDGDLAAIQQTLRPHPDAPVEITNEGAMTAFGGWVRLKPGEISSIRLRYELPFRVDAPGRFMVTVLRQPGAGASTMTGRISVAPSRAVEWASDSLTESEGSWVVEDASRRDFAYGVVVR